MKTEKQIHTGRPAAVSWANDANKHREVPKKNTHFFHLTVFKMDGYTWFKASSQKHLGQQIVTTCKIKSLKSTVTAVDRKLLSKQLCAQSSVTHLLDTGLDRDGTSKCFKLVDRMAGK